MTSTVKFHRVRPVRLSQRIVEQIEAALAARELQPGDHLPSERELVTQFGASRSTVREALRVLESNGVIRSRPGDPNGPEILAFSAQALTKQLTLLTQVDGVELGELIAFRMVLDSSANMLAARLRTEDELATMEHALEMMRQAIDIGFEEFSEADVAFHDAVAQVCRNSLIQVCNHVVHGVVLSLISDKISNAHDSRALMLQSLNHHEEVLKSIRSGDAAAAARASRQSLYDYYSGYLPETKREPLRALLLDLPHGD